MKRAAQSNKNGGRTRMKRRTEIKIELTRTLHIRRCHAAPCWCAVCAEQGEMDAPKAAAVLIDVNIPTKSPALCERRTKMLHSHHSSHDTRQLLGLSLTLVGLVIGLI